MASSRERRIVSVYGVAVLVFVAVAGFLYLHFQRFTDRSHWAQHTLQVITQVESTLGDLKDVETGQRGYLIAGEDDFLEPYNHAIASVRTRLATAERLTADNPAQQAHLHALRPLVEKKIAFSDLTIRTFRSGDQQRAREMVATRTGKQLMDAIRGHVDQITNEERRLFAVRNDEAKTAAWRTTALLVFGNGLAFALLTLGTIMLGREVNRRSRVDDERVLGEERSMLRTTAARAQRRLEAVIDELPVAIVIADAPTGEVALRNARMRELAGTGTIEPRHPDGSPYPDGEDPVSRALREGHTVHGEELRLERGELPPACVIVDAAPVRDRDGRVLGAVGVFHDMAEQRRTEAQRREGEEFRALFRGALGHDLRNPLSVITAGSASLARRLTAASDLKLVHRMTSSAQRMERMIAQLLELVQVRLGNGVAIERQRMDLGELTRNVLDAIDVAYPDRSVVFETDGELAGTWDRERLADVVRDLVDNALAHGRPDAAVHVTVRAAESNVVFEVRNEGNPIPPELLPLVFDPFRRAEQRKRMKSAGLGIGLYLAEHIVRAHGGRIDVSSSSASGTVFTVTLPRDV